MAKQILTELDLAANKIIGLAPGTAPGDAVAFEQLAAAGGGTLTGVTAGGGVAVDPLLPSPATPTVSIKLDPTTDTALVLSAAGLKLDPTAATSALASDADIHAAVNDVAIVTTPSTSLSTVKTGTSAGGDLTYTISLQTLTLADTITTPQQANPNTPLVPGQPGDIYIDTGGGTAWINDGTGWVQLDAAAAGSIVTIVAGDGIAVDSTTASAPVVSAVVDPASDPALTVSATGLSLDTATFTKTFTANVAITTPGTPVNVAHGLNRPRVVVQVYEGPALVEVDVNIVDANNITLTAGSPFTAGVIVIG